MYGFFSFSVVSNAVKTQVVIQKENRGHLYMYYHMYLLTPILILKLSRLCGRFHAAHKQQLLIKLSI